MHIHIAPVGTSKPPIQKVLNRIDGIDKLYLMYTEPKDSDYDPKSNYLDNKDGSMNESDSNMPLNINGSTNSMVETKKGSNGDKSKTSLEIAKEIKRDNGMGIKDIILVKTEMFSFKKNVDVITDIYKKEKGKDVYFSVNITSGTKVMCCAACYSAYFTNATMYYAGQTEGSIEDAVPPIKPPRPIDLSRFKPLTKDILRYIYEKKENGNDIVTGVDISYNLYKDKIIDKQLIAHHVKLLKGSGLIDYDPDHPNKRENSIIMTDLGRWSMPNL